MTSSVSDHPSALHTKVWVTQLLRHMADMTPRTVNAILGVFVIDYRFLAQLLSTLHERGWVRFVDAGQQSGWTLTATGWLQVQAK